MVETTATEHGADSVDFVCIGAQKSGTTFITSAFRAHPEIQLAEKKELYFFSPKGEYKTSVGGPHSNAHRDIDWYRRQFVNDSRKKGEISTHYILDPASARKIKDAFPRIKVFAILRNPVDRAFSQYNMERYKTVKESRSLIEIIRDEPDNEILERGLYFKQLTPFKREFSEDQLRIFLFDDVLKDPGSFFSELFEFIGVDASVVPPGTNKRMNKSGKAKYPFIPRSVRFIRKSLEKAGLSSVVRGLTNIGLAQAYVNFHNRHNKVAVDYEITPEERRALHRYFREDVAQLEQMIGRDLSAWQSDQSSGAVDRPHASSSASTR